MRFFWGKKLIDALETAYLTIKQHQDLAENEDTYIDGFAEKRSIIDVINHYYHLANQEAEEIYFEAVRKMDKELRDS